MLNVGDKVRVRTLEDLKANYEPNEDDTMCIDDMDFIIEMQDYCGKDVTIKEVLISQSSGVYGIEEDNDGFWWSGEMFVADNTLVDECELCKICKLTPEGEAMAKLHDDMLDEGLL